MRCRRTFSHPSTTERKTMYQAKTGRTPPKAMQAALAAFETAQLEQLVRGIANYGAMPHNLTKQQRAAVMTMARRLNPSL